MTTYLIDLSFDYETDADEAAVYADLRRIILGWPGADGLSVQIEKRKKSLDT